MTIRTPRQTHTLRLPALLPHGVVLWLQFVDLALLLQIEDDDRAGGGSAQPVAVGRENEGVDFVASGEGVEVFRLVEVPEHGSTVLASGGAERAVRGDGDGIDVARVTNVVGLDAAGRKFPHLRKSASCLFHLVKVPL